MGSVIVSVYHKHDFPHNAYLCTYTHTADIQCGLSYTTYTSSFIGLNIVFVCRSADIHDSFILQYVDQALASQTKVAAKIIT